MQISVTENLQTQRLLGQNILSNDKNYHSVRKWEDVKEVLLSKCAHLKCI